MGAHTEASATVAVLSGAGLLAVALGHRARATALALLEQDRSVALTADQLPDVVALAVLAAGSLVAAWYAATAAVALAALATRGRPRRRLERVLRHCGAPVLRRVLLTTAATGVGVAASLGGAAAATAESEPPLPVDLGWGAPVAPWAPEPVRPVVPEPEPIPSPIWAPSPVPMDGSTPAAVPAPPPLPEPPASAPAPPPPSAPGHRATVPPPIVTPAPAAPAPPAGSAAGAPAAADGRSPGSTTTSGPSTTPGPITTPGPTTTHGTDEPETHHVVATGESLWAIAASHLPDAATDAEIAAAWPQWYRANSAVVGDDPDLIRPGQLLQAPPKETS